MVSSPEDRLRSLLTANRSVVGELSLPAVLRRIVEAARVVSGARYAALGVLGRDGVLDHFVHTGIDADTARRIGAPPRGAGVLGAVLADPQPLRMHDLSAHPQSVGFPIGHPPMRTFLGVQVRVRNAVFGNLYLSEKSDGDDFTAEDEDLVLALAATAGIAIENARLYTESRLQQEWLRASGDITKDLLAPHESEDDVLRRVATSVRRLADADLVAILRPLPRDGRRLAVVAATGPGAEALTGSEVAASGSLAGRAMSERRGVRGSGTDDAPELAGLEAFGVGPVMAVPLTGEWTPRGAVVLLRATDRVSFSAGDLEMSGTFAGHAAVALELAAARTDQQRLSVLEDRDRIARDLHDHVIQRLFATGLSVQSIAAATDEPATQARLIRAVEELDDTIRHIRTSIFALRTPPERVRTVRAAVLEVAEQLTPALGMAPRTEFSGPLDTMVDPPVIADVEAVLREALTNVARHARASSVAVSVAVADGQLSLTVSDDGVGIARIQRRSGLANLRTRAEQYGGTFQVRNDDEGGLRLSWSIPLARPAPAAAP